MILKRILYIFLDFTSLSRDTSLFGCTPSPNEIEQQFSYPFLRSDEPVSEQTSALWPKAVSQQRSTGHYGCEKRFRSVGVTVQSCVTPTG